MMLKKELHEAKIALTVISTMINETSNQERNDYLQRTKLSLKNRIDFLKDRMDEAN